MRPKKEGRLAGMISCNTDGTTNTVMRMEFKTLCDGYKKINASPLNLQI